MSKIRRYRNLSVQERKLFRELLTKMFICRIIIIFYSVKKIVQKFKNHNLENKISDDFLKQLRRTVFRANKATPKWKNQCLINTLAVKWMLNKRKVHSTAYLGVRKTEDNSIVAHAWIQANNINIVDKEGDYVEMYEF